jgi:transcriptional regulator with XRE-family HTH domain
MTTNEHDLSRAGGPDAASRAGSSDADAAGSPYLRHVGERLRSIRLQKNMSLGDVETTTRQEFKASVLGAYERGERAISVPRLQRLAEVYDVSIDQLLPRDPMRVEMGSGAAPAEKLRIDVAKLSQMQGPQFSMLEKLLRMIQIQRQDFNGKVITVRAHDIRAIAVMLDVGVDEVPARLASLGLVFVPPQN